MDVDLIFRIGLYTLASIVCARQKAWLGWALAVCLILTNASIYQFPHAASLIRDLSATLITLYIIKRR